MTRCLALVFMVFVCIEVHDAEIYISYICLPEKDVFAFVEIEHFVTLFFPRPVFLKVIVVVITF